MIAMHIWDEYDVGNMLVKSYFSLVMVPWKRVSKTCEALT